MLTRSTKRDHNPRRREGAPCAVPLVPIMVSTQAWPFGTSNAFWTPEVNSFGPPCHEIRRSLASLRTLEG